MRTKLSLSAFATIVLSIMLASSLSPASIPNQFKIEGVPRVKQLPNYCGPAALASILQHEGMATTQEAIAEVVYDPAHRGTNGADMLLYAREMGFTAYSWRSSIDDVKSKIATGAVVLVLQQNSEKDTSGHFRLLTGYDDAAARFYVVDPYYDDISELDYARCERLWEPTGYWAMVVVPSANDPFRDALLQKNPVLHADLSSALYKRKDYDCALREAEEVVALEPGNRYAVSMLNLIKAACIAQNHPEEHLVLSCKAE